ncbi:MAG: hypothetical protein ACI92S_002501, partial [Planctomycetaceae bacterium]
TGAVMLAIQSFRAEQVGNLAGEPQVSAETAVTTCNSSLQSNA